MHEKYVTALKKIYGHNSNIAKSEFYNAFVHGAPNIHNTRNKEIHSRKRRIISNAFSTASTKSMEPFVHNNIRKLCELVGPSQDSSFRESPVASEKHSEWSAPQNMAKWFSYLTMDVLGDLCYGKSFDLLEKEDNRYSLELLALATKAHLLSGLMPLAYRWKLDYIIFRQIASGREQFAKYGRERLNERTALGNTTDRKDFFHYMLNSKEGGYSFSQPELWGESTLLLIAGSDTTAASLAATLFYLVRYPEIMAKVMGELHHAYSTLSDASKRREYDIRYRQEQQSKAPPKTSDNGRSDARKTHAENRNSQTSSNARPSQSSETEWIRNLQRNLDEKVQNKVTEKTNTLEKLKIEIEKDKRDEESQNGWLKGFLWRDTPEQREKKTQDATGRRTGMLVVEAHLQQHISALRQKKDLLSKLDERIREALRQRDAANRAYEQALLESETFRNPCDAKKQHSGQKQHARRKRHARQRRHAEQKRHDEQKRHAEQKRHI
ncbi:Benzoate 4-monooxygenase [Ceratocystis platani]|uniref:Benzoate 4-monooxygenase n=1 Tax=Ceratocystis fimbriata f. sp. platani TaxID=88771 RepID=A0A0F8B0U2_CERFI|nr:Benzoate 4-monooxygenase [Ceratocystis platani]